MTDVFSGRRNAGRRFRYAALPIAMLAPLAGCFRERPVAMQPQDYAPLADLREVRDGQPAQSTRDWLRRAHPQLAHLLPPEDPPALLTEELFDAAGRPIDVNARFGRDPDKLAKVFNNFFGLLHSAQGSGSLPATEDPVPPAWPGFEDVWIPVAPGLEYYGRLGLSRRDGEPFRADCIVLLPGIFGDIGVVRTRELSIALRERGLHVLAVELRGMGRTDVRYPDVFYNFGVLESGDLLAVSEWLQARPEVARTGLIGFCWGANHALIAAWEDGRAEDDPCVNDRLRPFLRRRDGQRHYEAGIMAFSGTYPFEQLLDKLLVEWSFWTDPVRNKLQKEIRQRMINKGHQEPNGDLRRLIAQEFARSALSYPEGVDDGLEYLRLVPYRDLPHCNKLDRVRVPTLVVHAANDPLTSGQSVADLLEHTSNPLVAGIVLPGGGHVGFGPYARAYFYSLILNFFDPQHGAAAPRVPEMIRPPL